MGTLWRAQMPGCCWLVEMDVWHSHTEDWRPWIIFLKIKTTVFFRLIASLSHISLCGELLKLTNLNVTSLLSPPSALSQLLRSKERKYGMGGKVLHVWSTCCSSKTYPHPPSISWGTIKGLSKVPQQEDGRMPSRGSREDGEETESTHFGSGSQLSVLLGYTNQTS